MQKNLFSPFQFKGLALKNRVVMPPMCMYSVYKKDGIATDWHYVHYVSRAIAATGLIMIEMTDVEPDGRITDYDLGLWSDDHIAPLKKIVDAVHEQGSKIGIQIAHAGRKAQDAVVPVAPSAVPFNDQSKTPRALTTEEVEEMVEKFRAAARRAVEAGFDTIEIHGAHGYLIHQFHSPLTNKRDDVYGKNLSKFGEDIIQAVKGEIPEEMPLLMRISAIEYVENGYTLEDSIAFAKKYRDAGVDILHITSGGEGEVAAWGRPGTHAAYQVPFARKIKEALQIPVIAVGRLEDVALANAVIGNEEADLVAVGRGMLRNPNWTAEAAYQLNADGVIPRQYTLGFPKK